MTIPLRESLERHENRTPDNIIRLLKQPTVVAHRQFKIIQIFLDEDIITVEKATKKIEEN